MFRLLKASLRWTSLLGLTLAGVGGWSASCQAQGQYLGGGFGYGGVVPGGVGYGGFAPGGFGNGFGGGVGGFGGLGYGGLGGLGYGGLGGYGGFGGGYGGFGGGYGGYGGFNGFNGYGAGALPGVGNALYNPFYINYGLNPTTLATGITPIAIQSAIANTNLIGSTRATSSTIGNSRPIVIYLRTPSGKQVQVAK